MNRLMAVVGTDTGIGKTVATGWLATRFMREGYRTITAKLVQTGCVGMSEDIAEHRRYMGSPLLPEDIDGTTCPFVFSFPASPHLSAARDGAFFDPNVIDANLAYLTKQYDKVLVEGAGGLLVPLRNDLLLIDFLAKRSIPVWLVTSARLGSINHTLLSLEALAHRRISVLGIIYNQHQAPCIEIRDDTRSIIAALNPQIPILDMPHLNAPDNF